MANDNQDGAGTSDSIVDTLINTLEKTSEVPYQSDNITKFLDAARRLPPDVDKAHRIPFALEELRSSYMSRALHYNAFDPKKPLGATLKKALDEQYQVWFQELQEIKQRLQTHQSPHVQEFANNLFNYYKKRAKESDRFKDVHPKWQKLYSVKLLFEQLETSETVEEAIKRSSEAFSRLSYDKVAPITPFTKAVSEGRLGKTVNQILEKEKYKCQKITKSDKEDFRKSIESDTDEKEIKKKLVSSLEQYLEKNKGPTTVRKFVDALNFERAEISIPEALKALRGLNKYSSSSKEYKFFADTDGPGGLVQMALEKQYLLWSKEIEESRNNLPDDSPQHVKELADKLLEYANMRKKGSERFNDKSPKWEKLYAVKTLLKSLETNTSIEDAFENASSQNFGSKELSKDFVNACETGRLGKIVNKALQKEPKRPPSARMSTQDFRAKVSNMRTQGAAASKRQAKPSNRSFQDGFKWIR